MVAVIGESEVRDPVGWGIREFAAGELWRDDSCHRVILLTEIQKSARKPVF